MRRTRGHRLKLLELRVLKLQKAFAKLAKWTHFKNFNSKQKFPEDNAFVPEANVAPSQNLVESTEPADVANVQNIGNIEEDFEEGIYLMRKVGELDANDDQQFNRDGINNPPEGTSSGKTRPTAPDSIIVSSIQPQNDSRISSTSGWEIVDQPLDDQEASSSSQTMIVDKEMWQRRMEPESSEEGDSSCSETSSTDEDEDWMSPAKSKSGRTVVNQSKQGKVTFPRIIETEESQREVKEGSDYSQGSARTAQKQYKRSPKKKAPTATLKSVSHKRLPSNQNKLAVKSKPKWKCPHCPKMLSSKSHLEIHIRSHTGERPFRCPHCSIAMTHAGNMTDHIRHVHPEEDQNLLPCRICLEKFPSRKSRTAHMKKHLKCYFCSRKSRNMPHMNKHLATHTGEKPFNCHVCPYTANHAQALKIHLERHH